MKKITLLFVVILIAFVGETYAQGVVTGTIFDGESNAPLPGANVIQLRTSNGTSSDFDGKFSLQVDAPTGTINVSYVGFGSKNIAYDVTNGDQDLGTITLNLDNSLEEIIIVGTGVIDLADDRKTPIAVSTVTANEIQEKAVGNVELPEVIKNTPSVFVSNQTGFGDGALFVRGFDDTNTAILLNGQPINSQEDGRVFWSNWAGIADIATAVQVQRGLGSSKLAISSVGGTVNIVMKAADRNKGGFVRFLGANDSYAKGTLAYDTGMNDKGWAFSVLVDYWQAHRKYAEGTFGQGQNYYFAAGYKPNDEHSFNFLVTGAPQSHGQRFSQSNPERFEANSRFNQNWGYSADFDATVGSQGQYTSDIDTERGNYYHKPVTNLNWDWNISDKSTLSSVLYASWGRGGSIGPRGARAVRTDDPDGDGPLIGQIDFFNTEQRNLDIAGGIGVEDARNSIGYVRRNSVNNHQWYGLISNFNTELTEEFSWNVGVDFRLYRGDHFRQITDFHGLQGWANDRPDGRVVTESYDSNPWAALFNFADEDQRIDFDYSENINYQGVFSQIEYSGDKFSAFFQGAVSNQSFKREERFFDPGDSDLVNKIGYNLKGGFGYTIDDTHTLFVNSGYYSRQPFLDNIFRQIRVSNDLVEPEVDNEDILGVEAGYRFKIRGLQINFNAYYTNWDNRAIISSGVDENETPDDDTDDIFLNIFDRGVNQIHTGAELELAYKATNWLDIKGYVSGASWRFNGEISKQTFNDDTNELISTEAGLDLNGVKVDTAPQFTAGLGTKVRVITGLSIDANVNYYAEHYLDDPDSRGLQTQNVGKVKPYSLTDFGLTYDFKFDNSNLVFRGNVYNAFNEVRLQSSDDFGFLYTNGITYNASLSYKF